LHSKRGQDRLNAILDDPRALGRIDALAVA
jgi:hypothetical protein